ncbi:hypothetical protein DL767_004318 [Monosporascus sp. MG133]|nr:hypothetical protein DL767_004318 [Monosporascus sp. MG133]
MPHVPRSAAAASLSSGAIVGIGVPSAVLLFVVFALLLTRLATWQDRRRPAAIGPASGVPFLGVAGSEAAGPKRLRKKSSVKSGVGGGRRSAEMADILDTTFGLPVLPPVLSRPGSFTLGPLIGDGAEGENRNGNGDASPRLSADAIQTPKYTTPMRRSLQDVRKASWIDEDALHGPRMAPPNKRNKGTNKKSKLFFGGLGLGRSLSERLSMWRRDEVTEIIGSPTLPCTDDGEYRTPQRQVRDCHLVKAQERLAGVLQRDVDADAVSPQSGRAEGLCKVCVQNADLAEHGSAHHGLVVTLPSDAVHIQKQRGSGVALEAAQQQMGSLPQKVPRPPAKGTTDVELAGILRSTAERLQQDGGSRSTRRQTMMMMPQGGDSSTVHVAVMLGGRGNAAQDNYLTVASSRTARSGVFDDRSTESISSKSQKSAPAVMSSSSSSSSSSSCAELEGCSPKPPPPQQQSSSSAPQGPTRGHRQQVSHASPASMISEPESLVVCSSRRVSESEAQTALSSPTRRNRDPALSPSRQNQQGRPYSAASAESSALSTLYSEDEAIPMAQARAQQSLPISQLRLDDATPTPGRKSFTKEAYYSPYHVFDARPTKAASGHDRSPKFAFEDDESAPPRRARRETMLNHPSRIPSPQPQPRRSAAGACGGTDMTASLPLPNSSLQYTIYASDTSADPFTVLEVPPKNPAHLSRLFPPLPAELAADEVRPKDSGNDGGCGGTTDGLPPVCVMKTAEPRFLTTQDGRADVAATIVPPPQQALRPMVSSPTLGTGTVGLERCATVSSVLSSEAGYSSVYDSGTEMRADTASRSSASVVTVPTAESQLTEEDYTLRAAGLRPDDNGSPDAASSGRESRTVPRASENRGSVETAATARVHKIQLQQSPETAGESEPPRLRESPSSDTGSRYSQDTLPPLATPTKTNNLRIASAVAELRRMNSQVSSASGHSTTTDTEPGSPTLPALRGGGCSPGSRNKGGGKKYLALGGSPGASPTGNGAAGRSAVEDSPSRSGGNGRSGKGGLQTRSIAISGRARRGTMALSGVDARTAAGLEKLRSGGGVLREGNGGNVGAGRTRQRQESSAKQIEPRASRLAHEEREFLGRPGVESPGLYDEKGFLRSSPFRGNLASPIPRRV